MITAKEISDKYMTMLMHDQDIKQKVDEITEAMYELVTNAGILEMHLRYDIETSKKLAFIFRKLGYDVTEYKHGKLHVRL